MRDDKGLKDLDADLSKHAGPDFIQALRTIGEYQIADELEEAEKQLYDADRVLKMERDLKGEPASFMEALGSLDQSDTTVKRIMDAQARWAEAQKRAIQVTKAWQKRNGLEDPDGAPC